MCCAFYIWVIFLQVILEIQTHFILADVWAIVPTKHITILWWTRSWLGVCKHGLLFIHKEWFLTFDIICFLLSKAYKRPESYRERYPLAQATQTIISSLSLTCQVQCNWLERLKRRYHSALLIHMPGGSRVPPFISTSENRPRMSEVV